MSLLPEGLAVFRGLVVGVLGIVAALVGFYLNDLLRFTGESPELAWTVLMWAGILMVVFGPLWYWVGRPIYVWYRSDGGDPE